MRAGEEAPHVGIPVYTSRRLANRENTGRFMRGSDGPDDGFDQVRRAPRDHEARRRFAHLRLRETLIQLVRVVMGEHPRRRQITEHGQPGPRFRNADGPGCPLAVLRHPV